MQYFLHNNLDLYEISKFAHDRVIDNQQNFKEDPCTNGCTQALNARAHFIESVRIYNSCVGMHLWTALPEIVNYSFMGKNFKIHKDSSFLPIRVFIRAAILWEKVLMEKKQWKRMIKIVATNFVVNSNHPCQLLFCWLPLCWKLHNCILTTPDATEYRIPTVNSFSLWL